ncbi:colipase isoform X1 [Cuculus canorus]|uniref:colipase isoform X1 n=1 Tax=Cuculus canorus TaxID=55661 RepID=UPI0023AABF08|nr:colipase isoform X1 [Cuculus canorus]
MAGGESPGAAESDEVSPQPPLLQAKQSQGPLLLPESLFSRPFTALFPSPYTFQPFNVLLGLRGPKLNPGFEVQPHQHRVQGSIPSPLLLATPWLIQARMLVALLTTWAAAGSCSVVINQHPKVFSTGQLCSRSPPSLELCGVAVTQVQNPPLLATLGLSPGATSSRGTTEAQLLPEGPYTTCQVTSQPTASASPSVTCPEVNHCRSSRANAGVKSCAIPRAVFLS